MKLKELTFRQKHLLWLNDCHLGSHHNVPGYIEDLDSNEEDAFIETGLRFFKDHLDDVEKIWLIFSIHLGLVEPYFNKDGRLELKNTKLGSKMSSKFYEETNNYGPPGRKEAFELKRTADIPNIISRGMQDHRREKTLHEGKFLIVEKEDADKEEDPCVYIHDAKWNEDNSITEVAENHYHTISFQEFEKLETISVWRF